jgi:hypothetical protein
MTTSPLESDPVAERPARRVSIFGRELPLPRSRLLRVLIGVMLVVFGIFGFLPILGFWMIPLGLLVLSYEFHAIRRLRRRLAVWWERRRGRPRR